MIFKVGMKVKLKSRDALAMIGDVDCDMRDYGGRIVTITRVSHGGQRFYLDNLRHVRGCYWRDEMVEEIVDEGKDILTGFDKTKSLKVVFDENDKCKGSLRYYALCKITDDIDKLKNYNTLRYAEILCGKWVIMHREYNRIYNKLNPHIAKALEDANCCDWKLDDFWNCFEYMLDFDKDASYLEFMCDFENGAIKHCKPKKGICPSCGRPLTPENVLGVYCKSCLKNDRYVYRFSYHEYYDGYPVLEKVNTRKVPVFGCEIERDYRDCSDMCFSSNLNDAMYDILEAMQGDQLKKGTLRRENVFMSDGSLNNGGVEWITFPHTFNWYVKNKDKFDTALNKIKDKGFKATYSAGNHIHINRDFFRDSKDRDNSDFNSAKMAVLLAKNWKAWCRIAKRDEERTRYTQKPTVTDKDTLWDIALKTAQTKGSHSVAVNLQHDDTIEIRLWGAIESGDDLIFFLDNMQALARYVKKHSLETVQASHFTDFMKYYKLESSFDKAYDLLHHDGTILIANKVLEVKENFVKKGENK